MLVSQVTGWAVLAAAAVTAVTGCVSTTESPSQVRKQASQVSLLWHRSWPPRLRCWISSNPAAGG